MKQNNFLELKKVSKYYNNTNKINAGLKEIDLDFNIGEFTIITGESGSGKSTLLNILSFYLLIDEGNFFVNGESIEYFDEFDFNKYKKNYISYIQQDFNYTIKDEISNYYAVELVK